MQNLKVHTSKDLLESTQFSFTKCGHLHILGKQTGNTSNFMALSESVFCPRSILSLKKWLPLVLNLDCIIEIPGKVKTTQSLWNSCFIRLVVYSFCFMLYFEHTWTMTSSHNFTDSQILTIFFHQYPCFCFFSWSILKKIPHINIISFLKTSACNSEFLNVTTSFNKILINSLIWCNIHSLFKFLQTVSKINF